MINVHNHLISHGIFNLKYKAILILLINYKKYLKRKYLIEIILTYHINNIYSIINNKINLVISNIKTVCPESQGSSPNSISYKTNLNRFH